MPRPGYMPSKKKPKPSSGGGNPFTKSKPKKK
jgi:hypothetical protein